MDRVEPVDTRSTMASARPSRGATSTAPDSEMTSTAIPWEAKKRRAMLGCDVATLAPARSPIAWSGESDGHGGRQATAAVAKIPEHRQVGAALGEDVHAGHARVRDAVGDELDHVAGAHEQDVQRVVLDARDEAAIVLLEHEARIVQQAERRLDQPALVGDGETESLPHRSVPAG